MLLVLKALQWDFHLQQKVFRVLLWGLELQQL